MADRDGLTLGISLGMEGLNNYWRSSSVFSSATVGSGTRTIQEIKSTSTHRPV